MKYYCTFWYPTIYHQKVKKLSDKKEDVVPPPPETFRDVSDKSHFPLRIRLALEPASEKKGTEGMENIKATLRIHEKDKVTEFSMTLNHRESSQDGFVQYWFDEAEIPDEWRSPPDHWEFIKKTLTRDVYHMAKEFYHKHEADGANDKSTGFITKHPFSVRRKDNKFIISFLAQYVETFKDFSAVVSDHNTHAQQLEALHDETWKKYKAPDARPAAEVLKKLIASEKAIISASLVINQHCENASLHYTHCKTLLTSRYNKSFNHSSKPRSEGKNKLRQLALNIRNSMRFIENIKYTNLNRRNRLARELLEIIDASERQNQELLDAITASERQSKELLKAITVSESQSKELLKAITTTEKQNQDLLARITDSLSRGETTDRKNTFATNFSIYLAIVFGAIPLISFFHESGIFFTDNHTYHVVYGCWAFLFLVAGPIIYGLWRFFAFRKKANAGGSQNGATPT